MENKELTIQIPEGYEIDREQSTFEKIVFKRKKDLTYEDIYKELFEEKPLYFITTVGVIGKITGSDDKNPNSAPTRNQLEQLLAINKLMNVAYYLNDGEILDFNNEKQSKYYLFYDFVDKKLRVDKVLEFKLSVVDFKSKDLAWQAVAILGEDIIKKALGV